MVRSRPLLATNVSARKLIITIEVQGLKPVNVGIVGLGTVGSGTFNVLTRNAEDIARRAGRAIQVTHIGARRDNPAADTTGYKISRDIFDVVNDPEVDILVELIGGTTVAKDVVLQAIAKGKHVVTANKALIAEYGNEVFQAAQEQGVNVAFEAGVAGGIPITKAIREGLSANCLKWVAGIIHGTGNFILTEMRDKGRDFDDVLAEAQALGYAEADPTFDVEQKALTNRWLHRLVFDFFMRPLKSVQGQVLARARFTEERALGAVNQGI